MAISKIKTGSITDNAVTVDKIGPSAVTSAKISDGSISNVDISPSAAISSDKLTVCTATLENNVSLLGFKMAVNEGLTVFNLVDGVVDEFHDESGTDESESSNDFYLADDDFYTNNSTPAPISAGFTTTSVTEPGPSTAGTNPAQGRGTYGSFTVPPCMTNANLKIWGAGGGGYTVGNNEGGGGGFVDGCFAVTPGQSLTIVVGEGGSGPGPTGDPTLPTHNGAGFGGYRPCAAIAPFGAQTNFTGGGGAREHPGGSGYVGGGGGLSGVFTGQLDTGAPVAVMVAGSGGRGEYSQPQNDQNRGGGAGGTTGYAGGPGTRSAQTSADGNSGGGGDQEQGGAGAEGGQAGGLYYGGNNELQNPPEPNNTYGGGGGAGYYGGGGGGWTPGDHGSGGGGSSYTGHPQVSCATNEAAANNSNEGGGTDDPDYVACTNEGAPGSGPGQAGEDGYVLITGTSVDYGGPGGGATTIVSTSFTANSVPTSSRIVVFEENVDTPTLNTDIIASISRDGGSTYTNATLTDSGYVTGSSGQRILTGQATISGQPSGQSMRWKLALANNTVKIHGVSLQWS